MRKFEQIIFFILLLTIPIQLGKHFWPNFSFVDGIRVDYLSPTIYLSDIFLILLFLVSIKRLSNAFINLLKKPLVSSFLFVIFVSTLLSQNKEASVLGIIVVLKILFFAFYVANNVDGNNIKSSLFALMLGGAFEVGILALQFFSQSSIGGIFYYFGERTFFISTPGIALFRIGGELILRPYGTFPHPNVAAFYLFVILTLILFMPLGSRKVEVFLKTFIVATLGFGIIVTFSRVVVLQVLAVFAIWLLRNTKISYKFSLAIILFLAIGLALFAIVRFPNLVTDAYYRLELAYISLKVFIKSPLFGVGLNNFFYHAIDYQKNISPTLLQPVHNIYLWVFSSLGVAGFVLMALFIKTTYKKAKHSTLIAMLFIGTLIVGMFDHYLLTLHQGQLILGLILGLSYSRFKV